MTNTTPTWIRTKLTKKIICQFSSLFLQQRHFSLCRRQILGFGLSRDDENETTKRGLVAKMSKIVKILFEIWCILFQHFLVRMFCNAEIHGEKIRQGHTHHTSVIRRTSHLSSAFYTWEHYCLFGKSHKNIWHRKMLWSLYDRTICESISFVCPGFKIRRGNGTDRRSKPEAPSYLQL